MEPRSDKWLFSCAGLEIATKRMLVLPLLSARDGACWKYPLGSKHCFWTEVLRNCNQFPFGDRFCRDYFHRTQASLQYTALMLMIWALYYFWSLVDSLSHTHEIFGHLAQPLESVDFVSEDKLDSGLSSCHCIAMSTTIQSDKSWLSISPSSERIIAKDARVRFHPRICSIH